MPPLLRQKADLWEHAFAKGRPRAVPFVFVRKGSECFVAAVCDRRANGDAHNVRLQFADSI
jgi:hypothetical protein